MSHHIFEPRSSFGIHQKRKKETHRRCHLPLVSTSIITFELLPNPDWSDKIFASHDINPVSDREIPHNEKPLFGGTLSTAASTATVSQKQTHYLHSETKSSCSSLQQKTVDPGLPGGWAIHPYWPIGFYKLRYSKIFRSCCVAMEINTCNQQRVSIRCSCKCSHYLTSPLKYD